MAILDYPFDDHGPNTDGDDGRSLNPGEYDTLLMGANAADGAAGDFVYPDEPAFANNAADIAELRIAIDKDHWYVLVVMNALIDAERTALQIALDDFELVVHGNSSSRSDVDVHADAGSNTYEIRVPREVYEPGDDASLFVAAGLWDTASGTWLDPDPETDTLPYFDVAFIAGEPANSYWREKQQSATLAAGTIADARLPIAFAALKCKDGCPRFIARPLGLHTRVFRSGQDLGEGVSPQTRYNQNVSSSYKLYRSSYQPYSVYVPLAPSGALVILMHYLGGNYMSYPITSSDGLKQWAEATGSIVVMPHGRGEAGWYEGEAEKDVFEVWRDIARDYDIDRQRVYLAGMSMGGYGAWRLGLLYPDQFARAIVWSGPVMPYT
ncbi:MAG TPA: alpha/beta hydrolase-fold protein, partial [Actinomycetota bacterium]|nr:alpha/beta hydrolase-fold protein [Actinomycetota bacterium]